MAQVNERRARLINVLALVGAVMLPVGARQQVVSPAARLQAAPNKDAVEGDLKGAIEQCQPLAAGTNRAVAARAPLRMAQYHQRRAERGPDGRQEGVPLGAGRQRVGPALGAPMWRLVVRRSSGWASRRVCRWFRSPG
jgi:hypothetical protein